MRSMHESLDIRLAYCTQKIGEEDDVLSYGPRRLQGVSLDVADTILEAGFSHVMTRDLDHVREVQERRVQVLMLLAEGDRECSAPARDVEHGPRRLEVDLPCEEMRGSERADVLGVTEHRCLTRVGCHRFVQGHWCAPERRSNVERVGVDLSAHLQADVLAEELRTLAVQVLRRGGGILVGVSF